ncbi:MAE_28990/MAE_18760 family HEPN-like nuclease [Staphylococcus hominis]|uniref:MAE_28990/MAE_18760 family HEPN-like nuclease n=1 Tax=Staphylococcus hominis TaxID=1290 RepID=UPI002DBCFEF9|nr:MAE_28990/MAE_18760 family HEPN-like nuclease [Staphylococcus hominis]MEB5575347.1 MAE_28990/MAE_18760 family HEPN-like nuclease [Staphylococcus hominis]
MDISKLETKLSKDLSFRKQEITILDKNVFSEKGKQPIIKSSFLVLYAHFEGFTKVAMRLYLEYINEQDIAVKHLIHNLQTLSHVSKIIDIRQSNSVRKYHELTEIVNDNDKIFKVKQKDKSIIDTESNLKYKKLMDFLFMLDLSPKDFKMNIEENIITLDTRQNFIDEKIVHKRNCIAHGENIKLENNEFQEVKNFVIEYMDKLKDYILEVCNEEQYKLGNI